MLNISNDERDANQNYSEVITSRQSEWPSSTSPQHFLGHPAVKNPAAKAGDTSSRKTPCAKGQLSPRPATAQPTLRTCAPLQEKPLATRSLRAKLQRGPACHN